MKRLSIRWGERRFRCRLQFRRHLPIDKVNTQPAKTPRDVVRAKAQCQGELVLPLLRRGKSTSVKSKSKWRRFFHARCAGLETGH